MTPRTRAHRAAQGRRYVAAGVCLLLAAGCSSKTSGPTTRPAETRRVEASMAPGAPTGPTRPAAGPRASKHGPPPPATAEAIRREILDLARRLATEFPDDADVFAAAAEAYRALGDWDAAEACWRRCLQLAPHRADAVHAMGFSALRKDRYEEAAELLRRAAAIDPRRKGVQHDLGCALLYAGQVDEAAEAFRAELAAWPNAPETLYLLGQAHQQAGRLEEALDCYRRVLAVRADHKNACYGMMRVLLRLGRREEAGRCGENYRRICRVQMDSLVREEEAYNDRLTMRALLAATLTRAGQVYAARRRAAQAEACWRRAIDVGTTETTSRVLLAGLYAATGRREAALALCREMTELDPNDVRGWINLGGLLALAGRGAEAEKALRRALRLAPDHAAPHAALARFLLNTRRDAAEARRLAGRAAALAPSADHYALLGRACHAAGDLPAARYAMRRAVAADPSNARYRRILQFIEKGP